MLNNTFIGKYRVLSEWSTNVFVLLNYGSSNEISDENQTSYTWCILTVFTRIQFRARIRTELRVKLLNFPRGFKRKICCAMSAKILQSQCLLDIFRICILLSTSTPNVSFSCTCPNCYVKYHKHGNVSSRFFSSYRLTYTSVVTTNIAYRWNRNHNNIMTVKIYLDRKLRIEKSQSFVGRWCLLRTVTSLAYSLNA